MRDMRRIRRRLEISLDRRQVGYLVLGVFLSLALVFATGLLVGRGMERASTARLTAVRAPTPGVIPMTGVSPTSSVGEQNMAPVGGSVNKPDKQPGRRGATRGSEPRKSNPGPDQKKRRKRKEFRVESPGGMSGDLPEKIIATGRYTIQLAAYRDLDEARDHIHELTEAGLYPRMVTATLPGKGVWYRIRIGDFPSELEANLFKATLAKRGIDAWVVDVSTDTTTQ